jgi:hypothetical protein
MSQEKITQQKEPPEERMRRMCSCAVNVEVEDMTGHIERLVANSMHFRTMNVREARKSPGRRRRNKSAPAHQISTRKGKSPLNFLVGHEIDPFS